jgi:hypothetical protein
MFATLVVVLPSRFSGGKVYVTHGSITKALDCSPNSRHQTSVIAWYTDVKHQIKPITAGYRLAISYNLIREKEMLWKPLPSGHPYVVQLRKILLSWKDCPKGRYRPAKLVCLLAYKYTHANLRRSALKGVDACKLTIIHTVSSELGFRLAFAQVQCHLSGNADDDSDEDAVFYRHSQVKPSQAGKMLWERGPFIAISNVVDLEGNLFEDQPKTSVKQEEMVPTNLRRILRRSLIDEQQYAGYQGNVGGTSSVLLQSS